jgi:hypothetical protein
MPRVPRATDPLGPLRHLTDRDRLLLDLLAEHQTLTTGQIAIALFPTMRAAQKRLTVLYRIGAVDRFTFAPAIGGTGGMFYTLGPIGDLLHPQPPPARSRLRRRMAIAANPQLAHLRGVNGFFTDLLGHSRTHPDTELVRWWSEPHATAVYAVAGIHPDGHGIWRVGHRTLGFFLEHDRGGEPHTTLLAKLAGYTRLAATGPRYPVLFHLPSRDREVNLHRHLANVRLPYAVATAVHVEHPADPIWTLAGDHWPSVRLRLHELPSDHGPVGIGNPHRYHDPHTPG